MYFPMNMQFVHKIIFSTINTNESKTPEKLIIFTGNLHHRVSACLLFFCSFSLLLQSAAKKKKKNQNPEFPHPILLYIFSVFVTSCQYLVDPAQSL